MLVRMHCNKQAIKKTSQCFIIEQKEIILPPPGTLRVTTHFGEGLVCFVQGPWPPHKKLLDSIEDLSFPKISTGHYQVIQSYINHMCYVSGVVLTFDIGAIVTVSVISVSHLLAYPLKLIVL